MPTDDVYPKYLTYVILGNEAQLLKLVSSAGNTAGVLDTKLVQSFTVSLPPLAEQRAIATALSDVDALLGGLDRLIAKKRDLKQATMQQLLTGQTRLPGFEGAWDTMRLGDVAEIVSGGTPRTNEPSYWNGGIKWCTPTDITRHSGKYLTETKRTITRDGLKNSGAVLLPVGALLLCSRATIGELNISGTPICTNQGFKSLVCSPQVSNEFLYYKLLTMKQKMVERAFGSTFLEISTRNVSSLEVLTPPHDEQIAIAIVLSDMDADIEALEHRRDKTRKIKQGMMQQLLTGRVRLVEPQETDAEDALASQGVRGHNWAINEAVVIAALVNHFGSENYPLGRKRYTKLAYLLHRHAERKAEGYLKKAAGPYNPQTKYGGPEKIAKENGYIKQHKGPKGHNGFIAADNIAQAEGYLEKWYGPDTLQWLNQFRFSKNDDLEVLTTVDMAVDELRFSGRSVDVGAVKDVIASHPEWEAKLDRPVFSDANIAKAIEQTEALFGAAVSGGTYA